MEIIIIVLSCSSIVAILSCVGSWKLNRIIAVQVLEVLSTTFLRRIMFIQIIDEVTKRKEITRGSLLDFVLLVWAIGSLS